MKKNPVSKYCRRFNRHAVHKDKRRNKKHKQDYLLEYLESLESSDSTYFNQQQ